MYDTHWILMLPEGTTWRTAPLPSEAKHSRALSLTPPPWSWVYGGDPSVWGFYYPLPIFHFHIHFKIHLPLLPLVLRRILFIIMVHFKKENHKSWTHTVCEHFTLHLTSWHIMALFFFFFLNLVEKHYLHFITGYAGFHAEGATGCWMMKLDTN